MLRLIEGKPVRRRDFITLVGSAAVTWPLAAMAQEAGRTYRVGVLTAGPRDSPALVAMLDGLRQFGFIEGQNLTIDWHQYSQIDLISKFAADLVKSNVDVIYANGDAGIRAAERATTTIPILGTTDDMVEAGLVKSLARPDGNTTGTSFLSADLDGKRQEILIESVPAKSAKDHYFHRVASRPSG
jgi:putative tryptophan/tyrosine transport system substrate-binding protein